MQTDVVGERRDSDYESDPEPTGHQHDVLSGDVVYESDTEVLNNTAAFSAANKHIFRELEKQLGT